MTLKEILTALFSVNSEEKGTLTDSDRTKVAEFIGLELANDPEPDVQLSKAKADLANSEGRAKLLLAENAEMLKELTSLKKVGIDQRVDGMIEKALSEGKILPKQKEAWTELAKQDPDGTEKLLAEKGNEVNLGEAGNGAGSTEPDATDEAAFKLWRKSNRDAMNMSDEDARKEFDKYNTGGNG